MNLGLDMSMRLQQKLSFQMIQSLKLLQVNTLQLEQLMRTELELNPVLETSEEQEQEQEQEQEKEEKTEEKEEPEVEELDVNEDSIDWEEYLDEGFDLGGRVSEERERPDDDRRELTPVYQKSLTEHLEAQLAEKTIPDNLRLLVHFIIGSLNADGYLRISIDDIAGFTETSAFDVEEALNIVWCMDPPGVGARNLQECLILQIHARHMTETLAARIVAQTWDLFEKLRIPDIARHFNVEVKDVQAAIEVIKTLNPKPGYSVSEERPSVIVPDLIVEKVDGEIVVMLNDRSIPQLHINKGYARMIRRGSLAKADVKKYVREKLNGAAWLIRSIEQRKTTMLKVMYAIVDKQKVFFEQGPPNLNPLKLQDVADMIGMHISTVSRVTSNKYVQTPFGIFELKYFFTEALGQDVDGADISVEKIKTRLRELIEEETPTKPFSDQQLTTILARENFTVARRTVAKYREQLRILPAKLRLKYE